MSGAENLDQVRASAAAAQARGAAREAEALYRRVLETRPADVQTLTNLGVLAAQTGRSTLALDLLQQAIAADATQPLSHNNLGIVLSSLGRHAAAVASFDSALALAPGYAEAHGNRAVSLGQLGRSAEALAAYDTALRLRPEFVPALLGRAQALLEARRPDEALEVARRTLALDPSLAQAHLTAGNALQELERCAEALGHYGRALELNPHDPAARVARAGALCALQRPAEALADCDCARARHPDAPAVLVNRGIALVDLQRYEEGLASFEQALRIEPASGRAHYNRAGALLQLARFEEALAAYDRAIELLPADAEPSFARGACLLLLGRFAEGWPLYEARLRGLRSVPARPMPRALRRWHGEDSLEGKTLFVPWEQGLGDTIQFCRYAGELAREGVRVILEVPPRLARLLRSLPADVRVVTDSVGAAVADAFCPLLSLPAALGTRVESIPCRVPYLAAEPARIEHWSRRIGARGYRIGICWQGSRRGIDVGRSLPLRLLVERLGLPGVRLISLQKHDGLEQLREVAAGSIETLGEDFDAGPDAFVDAAAVLTQLDLVISSDTAIAHLAGALGRETWVALRRVPDWRWLLGRDDTPWYPTLRLFRQSAAGDWEGVFGCMRTELSRRLRAERTAGADPARTAITAAAPPAA